MEGVKLKFECSYETAIGWDKNIYFSIPSEKIMAPGAGINSYLSDLKLIEALTKIIVLVKVY